MSENTESKRVLMKDIAKEVGVSTNTVSNALNNSPLVKEDTKQKILEVAERMGYIGNASARYLRSGKSNVVAIIVGDIANPHYSLGIKQMCDHFAKYNYGTMVLNTNEDSDIERKAIETAIRQNVDGIILAPTAQGEENLRFLQSYNIPFVLMGRFFENLDTNYVILDDEQCGYIVGKHFLDNGHEHILFLTGDMELSTTKGRLIGYKRALEEAGADYDECYTYTIPTLTTDVYWPILRALEIQSDCTAIITASDVLALKTMFCVKQIFPSKNIEIASFDAIQGSFPVNFPLITVTSEINGYNIGAGCVELLLDLMKTHNTENTHIIIKSKLVVPNGK